MLEGAAPCPLDKASPFGGEACAATALKPGATPSVAAGSERNPVTGRPGSGGRPLRAASVLTRTQALLHDPSATEPSVGRRWPEPTPAAQSGAACADALRRAIRLSPMSPG